MYIYMKTITAWLDADTRWPIERGSRIMWSRGCIVKMVAYMLADTGVALAITLATIAMLGAPS
jgi:hypothetical protein